MNAQEAHRISKQASLERIATSAGQVEYSSLMRKVEHEAKQGSWIIKSTLLTRYAEEIKHRLHYDGFKCKIKPLGDDGSVSLISVWWL